MGSMESEASTEALPYPTNAEDAALVQRLRAKEPGAFDELVIRNGERLYAVAFRMLSNPEDAQDAVQETFLKAFKAFDSFDGRSALSTWLHRITVTTCLMKLRTKRRKPQRSIEDLLPRFVGDGHQEKSSEPWRPLSQSGIQDSEMAEIVRKAVDELPENYREVLMLRDVLGMSTEEAAATLEGTVPLVKTRLHRARQALKTLLEPYFTGGEA